MRSISTLSFFAITILLSSANRPGAAQEGNPAGSYQQTCSDISIDKGNLHATCQDEKGNAHPSKLSHYEKCSDITNKNGKLECAGVSGNSLSQPRGSYTDSCHDIQMKGSTLHAVCKSVDGRELPASLKNANRCPAGVANINGILNCEGGGILPPGSYIASCNDVRLKGNTLRASCNDGQGHWRNSSLRDAAKCNGDIANQNGTLRCTAFNREKR